MIAEIPDSSEVLIVEPKHTHTKKGKIAQER